MVAALGYLVGYTGVGSLTLAGVTLATGGSLTLAGVAVNIAGSAILNRLTNPATPSATKPENIQTNSKNAAGPRIRHYGVVKVGGNVVFHRAKDGKSYRVIVHGHGEISGVTSRLLNNDAVSIDASGLVTDTQYQYGSRSRVQILERMGSVPATPYSEITSVWPAWTSAHRLDGLWTSLLICEAVPPEAYRSMYPNNEPGLTVLADTTKCYDPRTSQTVFTENMALAIRDFVASPDGFNRPTAFDDLNISEQADICDRDVALAIGGTEKMYRISGSYLLNEKPQDVLGRMLQSCAGRIRLKPDGKVGLKVGAWSAPEFSLGYEDILEIQEVNGGPDLLDRYNQLPARFNSHALGHVEVDAEPWLDADRLADDGEILMGQEKSLLMCPSHRQARQVMKIHMERENPKQEVTLLCKPKALPAIYEDTISLNIPQMALVGDYEVAQHALSFEKGHIKAVGLSLKKIDSAAFTLALSEQGIVQQLPEPDTSAGVPLPQNLIVAASGIQAASNSFSAGIAAAWQAPASDALSPLLKYSKTGADNWQDVTVSTGSISATIPGLIDGQGYDVSVAFVTPGGVVGDAVTVTNVVASAVTNPPAAPTNLVVTDAGGSTALVDLTASVTTSLWKTEIYRDGALVHFTYAGPGESISFIDSCGTGTFSWTARSVNVSQTISTSDAGPFSATIA